MEVLLLQLLLTVYLSIDSLGSASTQYKASFVKLSLAATLAVTCFDLYVKSLVRPSLRNHKLYKEGIKSFLKMYYSFQASYNPIQQSSYIISIDMSIKTHCINIFVYVSRFLRLTLTCTTIPMAAVILVYCI